MHPRPLGTAPAGTAAEMTPVHDQVSDEWVDNWGNRRLPPSGVAAGSGTPAPGPTAQQGSGLSLPLPARRARFGSDLPLEGPLRAYADGPERPFGPPAGRRATRASPYQLQWVRAIHPRLFQSEMAGPWLPDNAEEGMRRLAASVPPGPPADEEAEMYVDDARVVSTGIFNNEDVHEAAMGAMELAAGQQIRGHLPR